MRDATAIEARETFPETKPKKTKPKKTKKSTRRPKRARAGERGTRLEATQANAGAATSNAVTQLRYRKIGNKKSSKGHQQYWRGYKQHLDVADGQILSALYSPEPMCTTRKAAIPLMTMSTQRVTYLYESMDSAYDAKAIREHSHALGHQPINDHLKRRRKVGKIKIPFRKNSRSWKRVIQTETRAEEMSWAEQDGFV